MNQIMHDLSSSLSTLFDLVSDGVYVIDTHYTYMYINHTAEEQTGKPREDVLGKTIWELFPEAKDSILFPALQCALEEQRQTHIEVFCPAFQTWYEQHCYPFESGLVILARDITERKHQEEQQHFQATILANIRESVIATDLEGNITYWNEGAEHLFGYRASEMLGKTLTLLYPMRQSDALQADLQDILAGKDYLGEWEGRRKDGTAVWVDIRTTLLRTSEGQAVGFLGLAKDATQRKQAEDALRTSEARTRLAIKGGGITVYPQDRDLRYTWIYNPSSGYNPEDILGKTDAEMMEAEEAAHLTANKRRVMETGQNYQEVITATGFAGKRYFDLSMEPLCDGNGEMIGVTGTSRDVTAQVALEQQKDDFINMASHELKTPITTLSGYMQMLARNLERQGVQEPLATLTKMDAQVKRLMKLIDELLDASKIQAGHLDYAQESVDLDALVRETVEPLQASSPTHTLHINGTTNAIIQGDKDRLGQVFTNLITNAIKYSPRTNKVEIRLSRTKKTARMSVRDFGIGIDASHQQHLFERFYRAHDAHDTTFKGLGMGLYIAHNIVEQHGGKLTVKSQKGKGSIFTVSLPVKVDET